MNPIVLVILETSFTLIRYPQCSSLMNFYNFHCSTDYISSLSLTCQGLPTSNRLVVLTSGVIVVEPSPIRSLAADYPFSSTQDLTLCHLIDSFYFHHLHACAYFIATLWFNQLQGIPAIQAVEEDCKSPLCTSFPMHLPSCGLYPHS